MWTFTDYHGQATEYVYDGYRRLVAVEIATIHLLDEFYADMQTEEQPLADYEQLRESLLTAYYELLTPK